MGTPGADRANKEMGEYERIMRREGRWDEVKRKIKIANGSMIMDFKNRRKASDEGDNRGCWKTTKNVRAS